MACFCLGECPDVIFYVVTVIFRFDAVQRVHYGSFWEINDLMIQMVANYNFNKPNQGQTGGDGEPPKMMQCKDTIKILIM